MEHWLCDLVDGSQRNSTLGSQHCLRVLLARSKLDREIVLAHRCKMRWRAMVSPSHVLAAAERRPAGDRSNGRI
eukprot:1211043-Rhodomonas_salina.1